MSYTVKPQNPFLITEDYVSSDYFCDRERETELLRDNIVNGRNTVLISPRRMGKTGLIAHTLDVGFRDGEYNVFCIDLYSTSCLSEMVMLLSREITGRSAGSVRGFIETFVSVVKSLRPGVKYNQFTGELEFNLSLGEIARPEVSLEEIFAYLEGLPGKCIVAIDEFQQIADYPEGNVIALLRTCVQVYEWDD